MMTGIMENVCVWYVPEILVPSDIMATRSCNTSINCLHFNFLADTAQPVLSSIFKDPVITAFYHLEASLQKSCSDLSSFTLKEAMWTRCGLLVDRSNDRVNDERYFL
ncbi:hypothetical protein QCA50_005516 [Cerrena zonata]|uniref:Uncharacterized protein n=1 Tax=Cerrena zonata TaxID=2478898 RepID=A0AAW0GFF5_9APHY